LEPLASLFEEFLDPLIVDVGVPSWGESGLPVGGVVRLELHENLRGTGGDGQGRDEFRLPFQAEQTHAISLPEFPELSGTEPFEAEFHSPTLGFGQQAFGVRERSERLDQRVAIRIPRGVEPVGLGQVVQDFVGQRR